MIILEGTILFLTHAEKLKGEVIPFFCVFGRVPFLYYILHIYLIHLFAAFAAEATGFGWQALVLPTLITKVEASKGYGFHLITVDCVWILVIALRYPLCKKFDYYRQSHKEKW